jgi:TonB family protein
VRRVGFDSLGGLARRWPRWLIASGLLHAALVATVLLWAPATERPATALRVRLVSETPPAPAMSAVVEAAKALPPKPVRAKPPESRPPAPIVAAAIEPAAEIRPAAPEPAPVRAPEPAPRPPATIPEPVTTVATGGNAAQETGSPPERERASSGNGPIGPPQVGSALPKASASASRSTPLGHGTFLLQAGDGQGTSGGVPGGTGTGLSLPGGSGRGGGGSGGAGPGGNGDGVGPGSVGFGMTSGLTLSDLLRQIRRRIEEAKIYPEDARREGIQGTVDVRFRVAADGSVERAEVVRSSGSRHLDEASLRTVRSAAPYPPVSGWIRIPLSYHLREN